MKPSDTARRQLLALRHHHLEAGRQDASQSLAAALRTASLQISQGKSLPALRPYPDLASEGEAWTHAGSYCVAHTTGNDPTIIAVFHGRADIPGRL